MAAYYNEIDPFAAAWLRELIKAGLIANGEVDERSIADVQPEDVRGFTQCHFFAGIGGWSYALRLAGWPDDRPVWTGSCPCQGYSAAGKQKGAADARNLWPAWFRLIREPGRRSVRRRGGGIGGAAQERQRLRDDVGHGGEFVGLAESMHAERRSVDVHREDGRDGEDSGRSEARGEPGTCGEVRELANAEPQQETHSRSSSHSFWSDAEWIYCRDGKWRPVEPGTFPLAHWLSGRAGRLRGYGNAIVPQVAAAFIGAYLEIERERVTT